MFRSTPRFYHLHGLHGLRDIVGLTHDIHARGPLRWIGSRRRRRSEPSVVRLLVAGVAALAFVKLLSVAQQPKRSTVNRVVVTALLLAVGAVVMLLRKSARRYRS